MPRITSKRRWPSRATQTGWLPYVPGFHWGLWAMLAPMPAGLRPPGASFGGIGAPANGAGEGRFNAARKRSSKRWPGPPGGMVDAADLKSAARKGVGVRVPRWAGKCSNAVSESAQRLCPSLCPGRVNHELREVQNGVYPRHPALALLSAASTAARVTSRKRAATWRSGRMR